MFRRLLIFNWRAQAQKLAVRSLRLARGHSGEDQQINLRKLFFLLAELLKHIAYLVLLAARILVIHEATVTLEFDLLYFETVALL